MTSSPTIIQNLQQQPIVTNGSYNMTSSASSSTSTLESYANGVDNHTNGISSSSSSNTANTINGTQFSTCKTEWVRLNIGGQYFITTKTTLCKNSQSFFYKLCQDDPSMGLMTDKVNLIRKIYNDI